MSLINVITINIERLVMFLNIFFTHSTNSMSSFWLIHQPWSLAVFKPLANSWYCEKLLYWPIYRFISTFFYYRVLWAAIDLSRRRITLTVVSSCDVKDLENGDRLLSLTAEDRHALKPHSHKINFTFIPFILRQSVPLSCLLYTDIIYGVSKQWKFLCLKSYFLYISVFVTLFLIYFFFLYSCFIY